MISLSQLAWTQLWQVTTSPIAPLLGAAWLFGALAYASYALLVTIACRRMIHTSRLRDDERLANLTSDLSHRLGLRRPVRLWVTRRPLGPLSFGLVRPTVVLPEALAASRTPAELEPLLAHELVHVRRRDSLVGLLQLAARCLWWFHPLVWWAGRRIEFERERCCDEEVVAGLAIDPARYARTLLSVLELKRHLRSMPASPGARPFEITQRRLEHIMLRSNRFRARTPRRDWLALVVLGLLLVPGAGLAGWSSQSAAILIQCSPITQHTSVGGRPEEQPETRAARSRSLLRRSQGRQSPPTPKCTSSAFTRQSIAPEMSRHVCT